MPKYTSNVIGSPSGSEQFHDNVKLKDCSVAPLAGEGFEGGFGGLLSGPLEPSPQPINIKTGRTKINARVSVEFLTSVSFVRISSHPTVL